MYRRLHRSLPLRQVRAGRELLGDRLRHGVVHPARAAGDPLPFILASSYPHEILHNWWGNSVFVDYDERQLVRGLDRLLADHLMPGAARPGRGLPPRHAAEVPQLRARRTRLPAGRVPLPPQRGDRGGRLRQGADGLPHAAPPARRRRASATGRRASTARSAAAGLVRRRAPHDGGGRRAPISAASSATGPSAPGAAALAVEVRRRGRGRRRLRGARHAAPDAGRRTVRARRADRGPDRGRHGRSRRPSPSRSAATPFAIRVAARAAGAPGRSVVRPLPAPRPARDPAVDRPDLRRAAPARGARRRAPRPRRPRRGGRCVESWRSDAHAIEIVTDAESRRARRRTARSGCSAATTGWRRATSPAPASPASRSTPTGLAVDGRARRRSPATRRVVVVRHPASAERALGWIAVDPALLAALPGPRPQAPALRQVQLPRLRGRRADQQGQGAVGRVRLAAARRPAPRGASVRRRCPRSRSRRARRSPSCRRSSMSGSSPSTSPSSPRPSARGAASAPAGSTPPPSTSPRSSRRSACGPVATTAPGSSPSPPRTPRTASRRRCAT